MPHLCKLCHQSGDLRNSHIIPELCYLAAYDSKHRVNKFEAEPKKRRLIQKGLREYLLCDACEGLLSKLENKFKTYWYDTPALPQIMPSGPVTVRGFDYTAFKLFHLSILWRASIAQSVDFNTVKLGPFEDTIRQMLLNENPGSEADFPIFGQVLVNKNNEVAYGFVGKPQQTRHGHKYAYYASYAGVEWFLIVTTGDPSPELTSLLSHVPQRTGEMVLEQTPIELSNTMTVFAEQYRDS